MKAIIMAAGRGTRISRHIQDNPKCTVPLTKELSLIEYTIDMLNKKGITDISLVTGYKEAVVRETIGTRNVKYYHNPFFDITNSISSLWFARQELDSDVLIMNGDVFFEGKFLDTFLASEKSPLLYSDESRKEEADYKFYYETDMILKKYGKELTGDEITGEYVGVAKLAKYDAIRICNKIKEMIMHQKHGVWWENALYEISEEESVFVENVEGTFWAEVDYVEDYQRIQNWVSEKGLEV